MRVLLTYGKHPKTLAAVRSIGKAGHGVVVTDDTRGSLSSYSKYCDRFITTSSPLLNGEGFLRELERIVESEKVDLVIPMDDPECDAITLNRKDLRLRAPIALPDPGAYETGRNKDRTVRLARELGIATPKSTVVKTIDELREAVKEIGFPAVVKPTRSSGSRGFRKISTPADLDSASGLFTNFPSILAQEFIPHGGGVGVSYLLNKGQTRAAFAHRRLLEFPESGGASIVSESIHHPEAENAGRVLLEHLGWHGVAMAEFRIDQRTKKPVLMEVNPRFWGTLQLAIASGVDFPRLLCELYDKGDVPAVESYKTGVRCVSLLPRGVASAFGPGGARRLLKTLGYARGCRCFYVESFDDPIPIFGSVLELLRFATDPSMMHGFFRRTA